MTSSQGTSKFIIGQTGSKRFPRYAALSLQAINGKKSIKSWSLSEHRNTKWARRVRSV